MSRLHQWWTTRHTRACAHGRHRIAHDRNLTVHTSTGHCTHCAWAGTYEDWPETR